MNPNAFKLYPPQAIERDGEAGAWAGPIRITEEESLCKQ